MEYFLCRVISKHEAKNIVEKNSRIKLRSLIILRTTLGLCAGVALEFLPPVTAARLFAKDKCLEPMFGDVGQGGTNAAMLLMPIATTSSRICTKPTVVCRFT